MSTWIQTYTGRKLVLDDPRPEQVCIEDIAHALSLQCRFNGHCRVLYSVADHSIRVSQIVPRAHKLAGLLHDAAEAYIGDMVRPLKVTMPQFREVEAQVMATICEAFGVPTPFDPCIKRADNVMLATEARDLMAMAPDDWDLLEDPLPKVIKPRSPKGAERDFLRLFYKLGAR